MAAPQSPQPATRPVKRVLPTHEDAARELLARREAREHLLSFIGYTHKTWQEGEHHGQICEALERVDRGEVKRLMIFAPPRHSKSELASRRFPAWHLARHPGAQVISCSYSADLATDIGRDVRAIIRGEECRRLFAGVDIAQDQAAAANWRTTTGGIYVSTGVGGPITGRGATIGIIDDPLKNREEADSATVREAIWKWYTSTFYTRLMPGGAIVMMLTRWHEDDLASRALNSEQWELIQLPAITDEGTEKERALWPEWYPLAALHEIRDVIGPRDWSALYQQSPRTDAGTYCQRSWYADRWTTLPVPINIYGYSDLAVTEPREGADPDYTEHGVWGVPPDDVLHQVDWWHGQTTPDVWIDKLIDLIELHKPIAWFLEGGVIRRAVETFLVKRMRERRVYCRIEWVNPIADKSTRGRSFQARSAMGRVRFAATEIGQRVIDQCVAFPGGRHDDAFDVCAGICQVIDQAHPAITPPADRPAKVRDYGAGQRRAERSWKVV